MTETTSKASSHAASPPTHPSLTFRPLAERPDYEGLAAAVNASFAADGIANTIGADELESFYQHVEGLDLKRDILLAWHQEQVVGVVYLMSFQEIDGPRVFFTRTHMLPEWRSESLLTDTTQWAERRAAHIHSQMRPREAKLRSIVRGGETYYKDLLERLGYEIERYFYTMVRPNLQEIPSAPCPTGLVVRPVEDEHLPMIWEAKEEAFQDHWGKRESGQADYERWLADPIQDPALWKVAWDGDEVAGMVLNFIDADENRTLKRKRGYTEDIAVRRPWRRRGLASHLIAQSLRMLRERGMQEAALSVDVDNPSGALGLYERFGYEVARREYAYALPVSEAAERS